MKLTVICWWIWIHDFLKDPSFWFFFIFYFLKIRCLQQKWRISEKLRLCLVLCLKGLFYFILLLDSRNGESELMLKMNIKDRLQKLFPQNLFEDRDFFLSFCFLDCIWFIFYFFLFFCCFHFCGFWEVHNRSFFVAKSKLFLFSNLIPQLLQEQTLSLIWLVKPKKMDGIVQWKNQLLQHVNQAQQWLQRMSSTPLSTTIGVVSLSTIVIFSSSFPSPLVLYLLDSHDKCEELTQKYF